MDGEVGRRWKRVGASAEGVQRPLEETRSQPREAGDEEDRKEEEPDARLGDPFVTMLDERAVGAQPLECDRGEG